MTGIQRVTHALLDVVELLVHTHTSEGEEIHGWDLMRATGLAGPTVYRVLDRLEDAGWLIARWEENPVPSKPRRRYYKLSPEGLSEAQALLAQRRPERRNPRRRPLPLRSLSTALGAVTLRTRSFREGSA